MPRIDSQSVLMYRLDEQLEYFRVAKAKQIAETKKEEL